MAGASPWSDEYHSLFIWPQLVPFYPAFITTSHRATHDDNDDEDGDDDVNRGSLNNLSSNVIFSLKRQLFRLVLFIL